MIKETKKKETKAQRVATHAVNAFLWGAASTVCDRVDMKGTSTLFGVFSLLNVVGLFVELMVDDKEEKKEVIGVVAEKATTSN
jgi:hypothetical protein|nr:MAG TPA: hypothetical protein [Myoviridae sp. ctRUJ25]